MAEPPVVLKALPWPVGTKDPLRLAKNVGRLASTRTVSFPKVKAFYLLARLGALGVVAGASRWHGLPEFVLLQPLSRW